MNIRTGTPAALVLLLSIPVMLFGCGQADVPLGQAPDGWERVPGHWWLSGTDTAAAFRPLDDLEEMGVSPRFVYASNAEAVRQSSLQRDQLTAAVKQSLVRLYRNQPEVVDSLFTQFVTPLLTDVELTGDPDEIVEENKKRAYRALRRHFREPTPVLRLGEDIEVPYPDSLRENGTTGAVRMQVRINAEGEPTAIELIESVHPVLDDIAMRATSEMRWQPAYLLRKNEWYAVPSWSRFNIHFTAPE